MENLKIIATGDGTHTLLNSRLNETYHSTRGAVTESVYVFIESGLTHFLSRTPSAESVRVFEMGFGTGLNAYLTFQFAEKKKVAVEYHSIEAFPISREVAGQLNYFAENPIHQEQFRHFHALPWNEAHRLSTYFSIKKILGRIEEQITAPACYDVVYYDAFAPSKQAEVWSIEILNKVVSSLAPGGIFVTYCARGQLKRDLKNLGCQVETLPGPPGKKEMVRAVAS